MWWLWQYALGMYGLLLLRRSKIVLAFRGNKTPLLTLLLFSSLSAREWLAN